MTGLPSEPKEKTGDIAMPPVSPRHDLLTRTDDYARPAGARMPVHAKAEYAVRQLSRWAGPVTLLGVVALITWWIID